MDLIRFLLTVTLLAAATSLSRFDTILWGKHKGFAAELRATKQRQEKKPEPIDHTEDANMGDAPEVHVTPNATLLIPINPHQSQPRLDQSHQSKLKATKPHPRKSTYKRPVPGRDTPRLSDP
ncbi:hypothetical protein N7504_009609 [Penicillium tannophilum]|nr:hypothetical protein N7504_009609 [Penicillium tannophilum]